MHDSMKTVNKPGFMYYKSEIQAQMLLESATFARGAQVSFPSLTSALKSHHCTTFLQYLGKYAFVRRATRSLLQQLKIFDFSKKQDYSLCCICDIRKQAFFKNF
ncbi:conserved hypothetical protein, partial [Trichinella spiralis]|uniref:hypothetical protein n=1 Tax=Trichinella spiralis TaxID=6334 RepID=UPI0001EFE7FD